MTAPGTAALMLAPLLVSGVLAVTGGRLGTVLPPATAVRLLTFTALVTALSTGFVVTVAGFLAVAQLPPVAALGDWSARVVRAAEPLPPALGAVCAVTGAALMTLAARRLLRTGRDLAAAEATCRRLGAGTDGLVVVDDDTPDAYALPGLSGRIVVSTGMLRALPGPERRVLLAHEAAHLRHRHHLYVQAAELSAAANPALAPLARAVHAAIERWADEDAAVAVGDRRAVARAVARASLASHQAGANRAVGPARGVLLRMAEAPALVRARAMIAPAPRPRHALVLAVLALTLVGGVAALGTAQHTDHLFDAARATLALAR